MSLASIPRDISLPVPLFESGTEARNPIIGVITRPSDRRIGSFCWEIPNFFLKVKYHMFVHLNSPSFSFLGCNWKLSLSAAMLQRGRCVQVEVCLEEPSCADDQTVFCTVWLKNSEGADWKAAAGTAEFGRGNRELKLALDGSTLSYLRGRRSKLAPRDELTIICSMHLQSSSKPKFPSPVELASQSSNRLEIDNLATDLKALLLSADNSDAVVWVKGQEFPVHRAILGARTPVFRAMFRHETTEKVSGVVDIEDFEPDTVRSFLEYLYSGQVEDMAPGNAIDLYEMADKYQVEPLKRKCLDCIRGGLSVDIFCQAITLAMKHDERELTTLATRFFADNIKRIIPSDQWRRFLRENPTEANELLVKAICK